LLLSYMLYPIGNWFNINPKQKSCLVCKHRKKKRKENLTIDGCHFSWNIGDIAL
jgi:hypothetical protein